jgi:aminocarboxymuconate-semialdehyde decarboxylase
MVRLAATGIFDRHSSLKIITHHLGGMIPLFANRVVVGFPHIVQGTPDARHLELRKSLKRPFAEYLRMFYGDTVVTGCDAAFRCGLEYFGEEHVVFATDTPFSPPSVTIEMMARIALDPVARTRICSENAETLLKRNLGYAPRRASAA